MTIKELARKTTEALVSDGQKPRTAWQTHDTVFADVVKAHKENGKENFDRDVVSAFVTALEERIELGEISISTYRIRLLGVQRLTEMHDHGELSWTAPKLVSRFTLIEYFQKIVDDFTSSGSFSPKGISDSTWVSKKYFAWLMSEGFENLEGVGVTQVQGFLVYCSKHMKGSGFHNVKLYMKKLCSFLAERGLSAENYEGLFKFKVFRETKVFPATPPDDVDAILSVIDRRTETGKRNYAIILLGAVTGLRACDIARLRLPDINWQKGDITIIQAKTGTQLSLPLTVDVGVALSDYILNARPHSAKTDEVFLRVRPPYRGFKNGVAIADVYDGYRKMANLPRNAFDGLGFHSLRRSVGKNLVTSGVPVESAAQIIGSNNLNSMKKYVALDSHHLKECALDFSGIGGSGYSPHEPRQDSNSDILLEATGEVQI